MKNATRADKHLQIRLTAEQKEVIRKRAEKEKLSITDYILKLVREDDPGYLPW